MTIIIKQNNLQFYNTPECDLYYMALKKEKLEISRPKLLINHKYTSVIQSFSVAKLFKKYCIIYVRKKCYERHFKNNFPIGKAYFFRRD